MKRIVTLWMALLCLLSLTPGAFATETQPQTAPVRAPGQCGEDVYWNLSETGELTIYGSGPMDDFVEAPWAEHREEIYALSVGDEITYIGAHAFENLDQLQEALIGSAVTELGTAAFRSCDQLWDVTLPKGFRVLGEDSFRSCALLREIRFEGGMPSFRLNCLWDTTVELIYPAGNPWPLEHIMQLEEAFQGRIEFISSDGTDPYITALDEEEATAPSTEPEETRPTRPSRPTEEATEAPTEEATEEPTTAPTEAQTRPTEAPTEAPATVQTEPPTTAPQATTAPTEPEKPVRDEGGGIGFAIIMAALSLVMLGALVFGRKRPGGKYRR